MRGMKAGAGVGVCANRTVNTTHDTGLVRPTDQKEVERWIQVMREEGAGGSCGL